MNTLVLGLSSSSALEISLALKNDGSYSLESQSYRAEIFVNSSWKDKKSFKLKKKIDCVEETALRYISHDSDQKIKAVAFRVIDSSSNEEVAHCYATATDEIFSLDFLCVAESVRKSGIGFYVCHRAIQQAKEWKVKKVELSTFEFQAPAFYEKKLGFTQVDKKHRMIEEYSRIYFEKNLNQEDLSTEQKAELPEKFRCESFTCEYTSLSDLFKEEAAELKKIYDRAVDGLIDYNSRFLKAQDGQPRDGKSFAISLREKNHDEIHYAMTGFVVTGSPTCPSVHPTVIGMHQEFQYNAYTIDLLSKAFLGIYQTYGCREIVSDNPQVDLHLKNLNLQQTSNSR